ncbi:cyclin-dependent kinase 2-interacting protein [Elysia marginata]|uniref:Cyclin-dependent kinase 2-interacting protein n=1 Tax=Elysia marginata TaxID=1093978 RepID=A0AAV4GSI8_9GAST|nr:cyclin-dependent kinase 2-interacting protein [Elysia marginata]
MRLLHPAYTALPGGDTVTLINEATFPKGAVLESKLANKAESAKGLAGLEQSHPAGDSSSILFATMTLTDVAATTKEIHSDFHKELQLKRILLGKVAHAASRAESEALAACWLHQPYVRPQCHDLLQALLRETGHVK